jgi:hypothetical protein
MKLGLAEFKAASATFSSALDFLSCLFLCLSRNFWLQSSSLLWLGKRQLGFGLSCWFGFGFSTYLGLGW